MSSDYVTTSERSIIKVEKDIGFIKETVKRIEKNQEKHDIRIQKNEEKVDAIKGQLIAYGAVIAIVVGLILRFGGF